MFYERVVELCKKKGISPSVLSRDIGLSNAAPTYWKRGSVPKTDTVKKIADYFGVTVDYLLDQEVENAANGSSESPISDNDLKFALWGGSDEITDEMLDEVRAFAEFVRQRKAKEKPPQD